MAINIGNNNKIQNSVINDGDLHIPVENNLNKKWVERHPLITGILVSLFVGLILMFSFWSELIGYLEGC